MAMAAMLAGLSCYSELVSPQTIGAEPVSNEKLSLVIEYIKQKHPDAAPFIREGLSWAKSKAERRIGYTRSVYTADGWTIAIGHAATAEIIYEVIAEYDKEKIVWKGTIKNDIITEESYMRK